MTSKILKIAALLLAISTLFLFVQCPDPGAARERYYSKSFIVSYRPVASISVAQDETDCMTAKLTTNNNSSYKDVITPKNNALKFDSLARKHGDTFYNQIYVIGAADPFALDGDWLPHALNSDPVAIEVVSDRDWDENHPAGTSLNDIIMFSTQSYRQYIRSGYDNILFPDESKYTAQNILLSEATPADYELTLTDSATFVFQSRPTLYDEHMLTITIDFDNGSRSICNCRMKFSD